MPCAASRPRKCSIRLVWLSSDDFFCLLLTCIHCLHWCQYAAMARAMGAKVLHRGGESDQTPPAQAASTRGPSVDVRARVYRQLERRAERLGREQQGEHFASRSHETPRSPVGAVRRKRGGGPSAMGGMGTKPGGRRLSFQEIQRIFSILDKNGDGNITHAEFISGLKKNVWVAKKLGMPSNIRQVGS